MERVPFSTSPDTCEEESALERFLQWVLPTGHYFDETARRGYLCLMAEDMLLTMFTISEHEGLDDLLSR